MMNYVVRLIILFFIGYVIGLVFVVFADAKTIPKEAISGHTNNMVTVDIGFD